MHLKQQPPAIHDWDLCFEVDDRTSSWALLFSSATHPFCFPLILVSCLLILLPLLCLQILYDDTVLKTL